LKSFFPAIYELGEGFFSAPRGALGLDAGELEEDSFAEDRFDFSAGLLIVEGALCRRFERRLVL
jgi:hypothetical protein